MNGTRPISAADAINPALQHAKQQLLQPFRLGQWVRLALVGVLAGEMGSGFHLHSSHHHGSGHLLHAGLLSHLAHHPAMSAGLIAFLAVLGVGLLVLFIYISSVMRFILFDSIVAKECHIRQGWVRRSSEGLRLFVWQILFMLASLTAVGMLIGIPVMGAWSAGWFEHPREHVMALVLGGVGLLLVLLALVTVLAVVHVMTKDFVVPQMALENISALEGWRRLWLWLKAEKGGYAGYIGMKIVLAIGVGIVLGILSLMVLLMLLVPIGSVGIGAVLLGKVAGWTWNAQTIALAVALGCMALGVFVFAISMISVPAMVFFPAYSMYFFAPRYAPLAAVLWPQAGAVAPASGAGEPPLSPA
jgi:hypothetical protein